jgi:hypothetical protein
VPQELSQLRLALKQELEVSVAGKIVDVASAWSLSTVPSDSPASSSSKGELIPNPYATPSRGPSATDLPGLLNASSFIGVPEYSRMFKGTSPSAVSGIRARSAAGGVVTTSKESMVRASPERDILPVWDAATNACFACCNQRHLQVAPQETAVIRRVAPQIRTCFSVHFVALTNEGLPSTIAFASWQQPAVENYNRFGWFSVLAGGHAHGLDLL